MFHRLTPRGTQVSDSTLSSVAAQGATSLSINSLTGRTLLAGDYIGLSDLLFRVTDNATASANILTVSVFPPLRKAVASGATMRLQSPVVKMKLKAPVSPVWGRAGVLQPMEIELVEHIT